LEFLDDFEMPAKVYMALTAVCLLLDTISAFVFLILTGQPENKVLHFAQLFYVTFYFYLDLIYVAYVAHFSLKLPAAERIYTAKALMGLGEEMRAAYGQPIMKGTGKDRR
jgi:hypothetical protein